MIGLSDSRETIVAIASSMSPAWRGVVRITGKDALDVLARMATQPFSVSRRPVAMSLSLRLAEPLGDLDCRVFVWPTERSYTGSPSVEIHTFGSLPILEAVVAAAIEAGSRPAGPGEFTLRAFFAGRLDLTQAEAVLGVIDAKSRKQLDAALTQLAGNVSRPLGEARNHLLDLLADVEAGLDFVDEDITFIDNRALLEGLRAITALIDTTATQMRAQRRSESYRWVVLRGLPNAGKSSLLNAFAKQSLAIVSDQAGTTRDVVWQELSIGDYPVRLADTAGIEEGKDALIASSQQAANDIQAQATITIKCVDACTIEDLVSKPNVDNNSFICVATKSDSLATDRRDQLKQGGWLVTSSFTGEGLAELAQEIAARLSIETESNDVGVLGTAIRCGDAINRAMNALQLAIELILSDSGHELAAAEMRQALGAIGEITGEIYTDDILDRVFSRFCIGK